MSRFPSREEERPEGSDVSAGLERAGGEQRPRVTTEPEGHKGFGENRRELVSFRDRDYSLRPSEEESLRDLGIFRLIREDDLVKGVYNGNAQLAKADFHSLRRQGLIHSVTFRRLGGEATRIHTLSREGYKLALERNSSSPQFYYWGIVKPSEVQHDSLLYSAYLHEGRHIREHGGSVKRVVLDSELKRELYSRLNKPGEPYRKAQAEAARELHLPVIEGHVIIPDLRIEYEDGRGDIARADVEVATENYRGQHLAAKMAAGFTVYRTSIGGGGLRVQSGVPLKAQAFPQETRMVLPL